MSRLSGRYCMVGVGGTEYSCWSGRTTLSMACEAILKAARAAALSVDEILFRRIAHAGDQASGPQPFG